MFFVPNSVALTISPGPFSTSSKYRLLAVAGSAMLLLVSGQTVHAGNTVHFSGKSRALSTGNSVRLKRSISNRRSYSNHKAGSQSFGYRRHNYQRGYVNQYRGPHIINVRKVLANRKLRITINGVKNLPNNVKPHLAEYGPGQPRTIYYDEKACQNGLTCSIYLGEKISSPKIIVVGEKKAERVANPVIIHPPS